MDRFIRYPNLPESDVTTVIMSDHKPELVEELQNNFHINVISPKPLKSIDGSERYHADMSVCHLGGNNFVIDENNCDLINAFESEIIKIKGISAKKPLLNVCFLKDKVICNKNKTDKAILRFCEESHIGILHTNQSYAKCSTAVINDNAVITSDNSIYNLCIANQIDVLKISAGFIKLDGYDYGFIGGCCGLLNSRLLAFSGNIRNHIDYDNIKKFAANYHVDIVSLGSKDLYDIGSILPIR